MLKTTKKRTWSLEALHEAVRTSISRRQVLIKLGLRPIGGNYAQIKKYLKELKISTEHFTGQGWSKGLRVQKKPYRSLKEILIKGSDFQSYKLRNRLFKSGLKTPKCEECGWTRVAQDGRIPLELEHVNGDNTDNRLKNLKILCPNCHSMTPTYRKRKS